MNNIALDRSRQRRRRLAALSLTALLAATTLAACGDDDDADADAGPSATAADTATTTPADVADTAGADTATGDTVAGAAEDAATTTAGDTATTEGAAPSTTELSIDLGAAVSFDNPNNVDADVTVVYGFQTAEYPYLLKASGLFDDIPFKLDTPVLSGPQAQIAALYSGNIDVGLVGDNTAAFEWSNSDEDWTVPGAEPAIYNIAGSTSPDQPYPSGLFVRTDAGIDTLADLAGHSVGYNFGGNIYSAYVSALADGGLSEADIEPIRFDSSPLAATAFVQGDLDAAVTSYSLLKDLIDSGEAKLLASYDDLRVPGGSGFITRPDVLDDPAKLEALNDFFSRFTLLYSEWIPNNEAAYLEIQETVNKQTPEVAQINFDNLSVNRMYRVGDPEFIAKEQRIVDLAVAIGSLKYERDITGAYNPAFDDIVAPED
ncbi:MAG: ABC transporter substrate-binding protein [Ilumatobacteraceae bacterium]